MTFVDFDICHRMTTLQKLYFMTLIYFFEGHRFGLSLTKVANVHASVMSASLSVMKAIFVAKQIAS